MKVWERLLKYVRINTSSREESRNVPTSGGQFRLAELLGEELRELGIRTEVDAKCYVYAMIPPSPGCEDRPGIGFIAHMDTVSDFAELEVEPQIHKKYDGKDLVLGESGRVLSPSMFPHLTEMAGRTLITSDGSTILGADDKAGIAEIMCMAEQLVRENIPHGRICIGFTPDVEVGRGTDHFDVQRFGADFAYTVDGGREGEIEYENFNAADVKLHIKGVNVHPGSAKDTMVNAAAVGCEFQAMLPERESPRNTEGYEGFYHLVKFTGDVAEAELEYIIRDHDWNNFVEKKENLERILQSLNRKYGPGTVTMEWQEQYRNMAEKIKKCLHLIDTAVSAAETAGIVPRIQPIRGGTDGARLSYMGLPCPNLGTGGFAFHGPYEHVTVEGMELTVKLLIEIVKSYAKNG